MTINKVLFSCIETFILVMKDREIGSLEVKSREV